MWQMALRLLLVCTMMVLSGCSVEGGEMPVNPAAAEFVSLLGKAPARRPLT